MKFKLIFLLLVLSKIGNTQTDSSKAVIFLRPSNAIIYLDGKKIVSKKELTKISVGIHHIKAWAPKCDLFIDSFTVKKKENKFYSKKLSYTENYKMYIVKKRLRILTYTVPAILAVGFASTYYNRYLYFDKKIHQVSNDAKDAEIKYYNSFSPSEFDSNYNDYYQKVNDYKSLQNQQKKWKNQGIIISSTLAATAITALIIQLVRKKALYTETPLLSRIIPGYNPINKQICITVNLY